MTTTSEQIDLERWRAAAIRGDLPRPIRSDRWQPLRAGVVNLWEYDVTEVWYADGHMQLQGANESGKSTLMTLTTLLLLAGDLSSRNIDTLGESSKKFRYYVEPTNHPLDRRDTGNQKHRGWAWTEYGRIGPDGPEYFTTLLFAETRRADGNLRRKWCTLQGTGRVRAGLMLVNAGFVAEPSHLADVPRFKAHDTGSAYRDEIARELFGTEHGWLDQLIRILRVIRTPKIGDRLDLGFLIQAFREALPPLAEDEIQQLADGWDQLERMKTERDNTEQAQAAIAEFTRTRWRPWADAVIRATVDPLTTVTSELTGITRQETAARQQTETLAAEVTRLGNRIGQLRSELGNRRAEREALRERQDYQDAVSAIANAEQLAERAGDLARTAERSRTRADEAAANIEPARRQLEEARESVSDAELQVDDATGHIAGHAHPAGLVDLTARFLPNRDAARLTQAGDQRSRHIEQALRLLDGQARLSRQHEQNVKLAKAEEDKAAAAWSKAAVATQAVEDSIAATGELLSEWALRLHEPIRPPAQLIENWAGAVAAIADATEPRPVLATIVSRAYLAPTRRPLASESVTVEKSLEANAAAREAAAGELDATRAETDPVPPPPPLWRRRERPSGISTSGASLWRLVEVTGERVDIALLEAALDAAGLLQAWITPDGAYLPDRDGAETVWTTSFESAEASLRDILRPADDAGDLGPTIDRLLRTVAYGESLPAGQELAICRDGRWRHGPLTGIAAATAQGPRLLGAAARAADRTRRIGELEARLAQLASEANELLSRQSDLTALLTALDQAENQLPSDTLVVAQVLELRQAEAFAKAAEEESARAGEAAKASGQELDNASAEVAQHAQAHDLPPTADQIRAQQSAVGEYLLSVRELVSALQLLPIVQEASRQTEKALAGYVETHQRAIDDATGDQQEADRARAKANAARIALSQSGQDLLASYQDLGTQIDKLAKSEEAISSELSNAEKRQIKADGILEQVEERRLEAEARRQTAMDDWFSCVDSGLPTLRGLEPPATRNVTGARDSARLARAAITPRDWPDDPAAAGHRVQRAWSQLADGVAELRSRLETLGGRTVRTLVPGDGDANSPGAVEIIVDGTGVAQPPPTAVRTLDALLERLETEYDEELTKTIDQLLGSAFIEHLRERLVEAERLRRDINAKLQENPTSTTGLTLRMVRKGLAAERAANDVLDALERRFGLLPEATQDQVRSFLVNRVTDAQEQARAGGDHDWRTRLAEILDYRRWFELRIEYRAAGNDTIGSWRPLDRDNHSLLSGGAKVVTLLQPFIAALHAMYDQSGVGPRMMWLDEAFDGVDPDNRATMLRLLTSCDLDWLIAGPGPIVNATTVPMATIYEVRRAPRPIPGVSLELALWSGHDLTHVATPDPADLPDHTSRPEEPTAEVFDLDPA
ncbi:TIGR02680 family protein [Kribbella sp. CA-294648]|uniref:TIGR02680 family protein n=1 Tax=Kribbella sp. CA-294648 TaxID=3239948 RepID=UPI003D8A5AB8